MIFIKNTVTAKDVAQTVIQTIGQASKVVADKTPVVIQKTGEVSKQRTNTERIEQFKKEISVRFSQSEKSELAEKILNLFFNKKCSIIP